MSSEIDLLIRETIHDHKRIIFNGNGYSESWIEEAARRGLPNIPNTVDAIAAIRDEKNLVLMEKHAVLSRTEMDSRCEIQYELYIKTINIEALTMLEMAKRQLLPAVISYRGYLAEIISNLKAADTESQPETDLLNRIGSLFSSFSQNLMKLEEAVDEASSKHSSGLKLQAESYRDLVFTAMSDLREDADGLEAIIDQKYWPIPTYSDLLFNV